MNAEILAFWDDLESKLTPGLIERTHETAPDIIIVTKTAAPKKHSWLDFFKRKTFDYCDISFLHTTSAHGGHNIRLKGTFILPTLKIKCVPDHSSVPVGSCSGCWCSSVPICSCSGCGCNHNVNYSKKYDRWRRQHNTNFF